MRLDSSASYHLLGRSSNDPENENVFESRVRVFVHRYTYQLSRLVSK